MIASIYIKEHSYLTDKPLTLNFGGEYLYSFEEIGKSLIISRKKNEKYIPNFFNISESDSKIELLSAIVGENGVGKSSILDIIRSVFSDPYIFAFAHSIFVVLVEIEGKTKVLYSNTSFKYYLKESAKEIEKVNNSESYQSIYYSPHFDLKYNSNYDELDKYDISLDEYIKEDLRYIEPSSDVHNQLCFKNTLRIIEFVSSDIFRREEILSIFNIPNYEYVSLIFEQRKIKTNDNREILFHNTPFQFRGIINGIYKKLDYEIFTESNNLKKYDDNNNVINKITVKKYILKRILILSMLSVIIDMLEERNTYLDEGILENKDSLNEESSDIVTLFLFFIKNTYVKNGGKYKIFQDSFFEDFLDEIFNIIDSTVNENDITDNTTIRVKVENIKNLIKLHREIARGFMNYPNMSSYKNINQYEFITIDPLGRSMSSGELSILNFFSKLYYFLVYKMPNLSNKQNYILLLDEADLGLHPMWKKRFIDIILKSVPYFFEGLNSKPNLQIILTTHDPLTLSDIPKHNVIFLEKTKEGKCQILSKVQKTFGANITDLLADSFFIKDGLIGNFAKSKIEDVIDWINDIKSKRKVLLEEELEYCKNVIELIDERVIKLKLSEMITELLPDNTFYNDMIDKEIEKLQNQKK
jgi:hypothetical protein